MIEPGRGRSRFGYRASPSLALLKYWGKLGRGHNLPATPSLALALGALSSRTLVEASFQGSDEVLVDGMLQPQRRYAEFFDALRLALRPARRRAAPGGLDSAALRFRVGSRNDFPGSSGLASSSSGFAALALAAVRAGEDLLGKAPEERLSSSEHSRLARAGSVSAARAVFGGFSFMPAGASEAKPLYGETHWPELRVLVALVSLEPKALPSRRAMELCRRSSVFYRSWVRASSAELQGAIEALARRDLEGLGSAMRRSYSRMFGAMFGSDPPTVYWLPGSLAILRECESMRREGIGVWETMDAGPQVKMLCLAVDLPRVAERIGATRAAASLIESGVGGAPEALAFPEPDQEGPGELRP